MIFPTNNGFKFLKHESQPIAPFHGVDKSILQKLFLDSLAIAYPSYISTTLIVKSLPFVHNTNAPTLGSMTFNTRSLKAMVTSNASFYSLGFIFPF
jgi:hypothetical protein